MAGGHSLAPLGGTIEVQIHIAAEPRARFPHRAAKLPHIQPFRDDQNIGIALEADLAARQRTEDDRGENVFLKPRERGAQDADPAGRLGKQLLQLAENGGIGSGLEIDLATALLAADDAHFDERCQFPLDRPQPRAAQTRDLTKMKPLVRPQRQQPQDRLPGFAEQAARTLWFRCCNSI